MAKKILIVGGVAGGATAAARIRRLDETAQVILFERGEYISFANCGLPYYIGNIIKKRDRLLVTTREDFMERYNIDIRNFSEVTAIDRAAKQVTVVNALDRKTYTESYDKLILSPGAEPVRPPIEGMENENFFTLRNIPDTDRIKARLDKEKPEAAVVVGGGFIGIEMAENLAERGVKVTLVEMLDQVLAPLDYEMATIVHAHLREKGVECRLSDGVQSFSKKDGQVVVHTRAGGEIPCDMVIMAVGVRPENRLAKEAGLKIGGAGGIIVDGSMRTSDPHIYAVGDAVEVRDFVTGLPVMTALAGPANKQGRIAADNVTGGRSVFKGTLGTMVVKVFDQTVAATGPNAKSLERNGVPHLVSYTHSSSHATYYPGADNMAVKLIFSPGSGRVLGAQIVGGKGVDKRIDIFATAIKAGMTVYDLEELELAYAPPYGSAKDPVNIAGFVAANQLKGDLEVVHWNELPGFDPENEVLMDLRTKRELEKFGILEGAIHIPIDELRSRLSELDREKIYIPYCAVGLRGYIGHRILVQNGFSSRNLSGGMETLMGCMEKLVKEKNLALKLTDYRP